MKGLPGYPHVIAVTKLEHERVNFGEGKWVLRNRAWKGQFLIQAVEDASDVPRKWCRLVAFPSDSRVRSSCHGEALGWATRGRDPDRGILVVG